MIILSDEELAAHPIEGSVCTIGNFDGVHQGHQAILRMVRDQAVARSDVGTAGPARVVVTFDPHPRAILGQARGESSPALLTTFQRKAQLLEAEGVDILVRVNFTHDTARMTPEAFIDAIIMPLHPRTVIVGHDFSFGRGGRGTPALLRARGAELNFDVTQAPAVLFDDTPISSSRIRALLAAGEITRATALLGRPHEITGPVVSGAGRGVELGYPTANVDWGDQMLPGDGVYAGRVMWDDQQWGAMMNIGVKPTFGDKTLTLEAHLFECSSDLYDKTLTLSFLARLRDEIAFDSADALAAQLAKDEQAVRAFLDTAKD